MQSYQLANGPSLSSKANRADAKRSTEFDDVSRLGVELSGLTRVSATEAAETFKLLGDPTRCLVLQALAEAGSLSVVDLARAVGMGAPAVCHHLNVLKDLGLVRAVRDGRYVRYSLDEHDLLKKLTSSLSRVGISNHTTDRPIRIGSTLPLTGFAAPDGQEQLRAISLAVEAANARGGVQGRLIEHVYLDVADMHPKHMVRQFHSLINDYRVDAIVNGYLLYTGEEYDVVAQGNVVYVHCNTSSLHEKLYMDNPSRYWMCFQCDPPERFYALGFNKFLQFLIKSGGFRPAKYKIAIVHSPDPYSANIATTLLEHISEIGWTCSIFEKVQSPCLNWAKVLRRIRFERPDVVFLSDIFLEDNITFVQEFLDDPIPCLIYGQYAPTLKEYVDVLGDRATGTITSTVQGVLPGEAGDQYRSSYCERWGVDPGASIGGIMYDAVNLYLTAVAIAGNADDRLRVCNALEGLWLRGITGVCHFTRKRTAPSFPTQTLDPSYGLPHLFYQVQDGRQQILYPPPYVETRFTLPPWCAA